ncbi:MAG: DUF2513 domain-containing protein [Desulfobacterales bacterium]|nr:DUF2513 domain-containing protein [Desulfobacterales bacterium]
MNRDMDAIRKILIAIRDADKAVSSVEGISDDTFKFNTMLLIEAGLILGKSMPNNRSHSPVPAAVFINRLTWDGFEFADSIEDEAIWEKAKRYILKPAGSWTFGIFSEYLKYEIKTKLGMHSSS